MRKKKKKGTTKFDKSTVKCVVGITECDNETIKYKKKNKGTTKYNKRTVTYDIGTAQCEGGIIKCEKKIKKLSNVTEV